MVLSRILKDPTNLTNTLELIKSMEGIGKDLIFNFFGVKVLGEKYYLKPHAENDFFRWVNSWSVMVKMPSDLGYSDEGYILPELITNTHTVKNQSLIDVNGQYQLFVPIAHSMTEVRHEQKQTIKDRCELAAIIAQNKTSVYWCNFNEESD